MIILGVDPGATTGWCMLECLGHSGLIPIVGELKGKAGTLYALELLAGRADSIAIEDFVVGRKSMRGGAAGSWTRELIGHVEGLAAWQREGTHALPVAKRSASQVKGWATDRRLAPLHPDPGLPHGLDALRHALYSAVRDFGRPDPLTL